MRENKSEYFLLAHPASGNKWEHEKKLAFPFQKLKERENVLESGSRSFTLW